MPDSIWSEEVNTVINAALDNAQGKAKQVQIGDRKRAIPTPFPSPKDWRDHWIYFLLVDRFDSGDEQPRDAWNAQTGIYQGGTFNGVRRRLDYLKTLGVGAIWLSPVLKNSQWKQDGTFHGYGIQDFLAIEPRFSVDPDRARADPSFAEAELEQLIDACHACGIYVIFDIVLNHAGDVFAYRVADRWVDQPDLKADGAYRIGWRDADGTPLDRWTEAPRPDDHDLHPDACIWPSELRDNAAFSRRGRENGHLNGDFYTLRELAIWREPVLEALIRIHQYLIARFDFDGMRIDALKHIEREAVRRFCGTIQDFATSIGKENFFMFGEVTADEDTIASFIDRSGQPPSGCIDAALDFPLFQKLPGVAKGLLSPAGLADVYESRNHARQAEAGRFFVTFLDNHDQTTRFRSGEGETPDHRDDQVTLGLACLFALQGIPCLYYGTEQGLCGRGNVDMAVREALWGKPGAFDRSNLFYEEIRKIAALRAQLPALRHGRQYFRPVSANGCGFGVSPFPGGIIAFSRILGNSEVLVVANTHTAEYRTVHVIVDRDLHPAGRTLAVRYSNKADPTSPSPVEKHDDARVNNPDGTLGRGPVHATQVTLAPIEVQILTSLA
jgi:glycosidase